MLATVAATLELSRETPVSTLPDRRLDCLPEYIRSVIFPGPKRPVDVVERLENQAAEAGKEVVPDALERRLGVLSGAALDAVLNKKYIGGP